MNYAEPGLEFSTGNVRRPERTVLYQLFVHHTASNNMITHNEELSHFSSICCLNSARQAYSVCTGFMSLGLSGHQVPSPVLSQRTLGKG